MTLSPIRFLERSSNRKLSPVDLVENTTDRLRPVPRAPFCSSTYVAISQSCPDGCAFKAPGPTGTRPCYADAGFTAPMIRRLEEAAEDMSPKVIARHEAFAIDRAFGGRGVPQDGALGGRDLRLHVAGDARSPEAAQMLARAADRWKLRKGGSVWTFTHAWRSVPRRFWGTTSVLASVESGRDGVAALRAGYAPALVVEEFPRGDRAFESGGARFIPCPAETRGTTCVECRLCLDRDLVALGAGVAFRVHGRQSAEAKRRLPVVYRVTEGKAA